MRLQQASSPHSPRRPRTTSSSCGPPGRSWPTPWPIPSSPVPRGERPGGSGTGALRTLVPQLVEIWITWTAGYVHGSPTRRRAEAEASVAILDGLLLLRQMAGSVAADRAAKRIGVSTT